MSSTLRVVDCDTHFWQPIDLWEDYIDPSFRDIVRETYAAIVPPNVSANSTGTAGAYVGGRGSVTVKQAQKIRGGDHPEARIEWMDSEGIEACVIYPSLAGALPLHPNVDLAAAACRALNRWSADFASFAPKRLKPCMLLPWYDPARALEELDHALSLGLEVAFATPTPSVARRWSDLSYDPLWRALEQANVVMTFHEFTRIPGNAPNTIVRAAYRDVYAMMYLCGHTLEQQLTLMDLILGGVFSRFPRLKIGFVEAHVAWLPGWLAMLDQQWDRAISSFKDRSDWGDTAVRPVDLFRRQGFIVAFPDDKWVHETMRFVGPDVMMVSTDFPHPQARKKLVELFDEKQPELSDDWRRKALGENGARVFGLTG